MFNNKFHIHQTRHERSSRSYFHRHTSPYMALVLKGSYIERSVDGAFECGEGSLVFHPAWHAHENIFFNNDTIVLNWTATGTWSSEERYSVTHDLPEIDPQLWEMPNQLLSLAKGDQVATEPEPLPNWLEAIAAELRDDTENRSIKDLAENVGISAEHTTRKFKCYFGLGPSAYRQEHRLRRAITGLERGLPPAAAAFSAGFSDQSHMGRALKKCTGMSPRNYQGMTQTAL